MMKSTSTPSLNVSNENKADIMSGVQKSHTTSNCVVEKKRGFKPSDRHDPTKKQFLTHLSQQIWQKRNEYTNASKSVDLHKIFTPATDAEEILPKNRKLYASSAFYSPTLHPTVEDQVELARRISHSLSDISNQQSKGQSMYMNRKKRSVKWVHEGSGQDLYMPKEISFKCSAPPSVADVSAQNLANEKSQCSTYKPLNASPVAYSLPEYSPGTAMQLGGGSTFPVRNPHQQGFSAMFCNNTPPKQHLPPQSYQEIPQNTSQNDCQFYLNPSPLPYNKLAKFENQPTDECRNFYSPPSHDLCLKIQSTKVRNTSPAPFDGSYNRPYTPSYDNHCYGGTPSPSFTPLSIKQHNTPNLLHTRVTSNQILNAPSYNSSARGWGSGGCAAEGSQILQSFTNPTKLKVANSLCTPYTDF